MKNLATSTLRRLKRYVKRAVIPTTGNDVWEKLRDGKIHSRNYKSYNDYVNHQAEKLTKLDNGKKIAEYDAKLRVAVRKRLTESDLVNSGSCVICLAARLGGEVRAFLDIGCFAIGIDLNPGPNNHYVVKGDIHNIQFPDNSVDVVFTNAFDHILDHDQAVSEIQRILKPGGLFILESVCGVDEGYSPGPYETFIWSSIDDLINMFERRAFQVIHRSAIKYPWQGEHVSFKYIEEG